MEIFPAIDLKNGQCVRLTKGDFDTAKIYEADPLLQARKFADAGASWLHIVDLDGARDGEMKQINLITKIVKETPLKIQAGGGIRGATTIQKLLDAGVERVVIGSLAVKNKELVHEWIKQFGAQHITLAFDIEYADNEPEVLTQGWQSGSQQILWDVLDAYEGSGLQNILCTDVGRDGMLEGPNLMLYQEIEEYAPRLSVLASGGVTRLEDLVKLTTFNVAGVIIGKALYEGRIDLAEAIRQVGHAG
jgi:phosphoribosylformimino-5-aminoimidazole carboxamide ribotide isomerase